jgi:hypothetical protein
MPDPFTAEPVRARRSKPAADAPKARDLDLSQIELGRWVFAGTGVDEPYPCLCERWAALSGWRSCGRYCPCAGRDDTGGLPQTCCAVRPRGRGRIMVAAPLPIPALQSRRLGKLRPPAVVTAADVLAAIARGR